MEIKHNFLLYKSFNLYLKFKELYLLEGKYTTIGQSDWPYRTQVLGTKLHF